MRNQVTVKPVKGHPRYSWRVNFPESLPDGTRVRRQSFFTDKRSAQSFASTKQVELGNLGVRHGEVTDAERHAVIHFRGWAAGRSDAPSLLSLILEGIARAESDRPLMTVSQAVEERVQLLKRNKASARHQDDTSQRLAKFAEAFGSTQVSAVTSREIEAWLHGLRLAPGTLANFRRVVSALFVLAMRRGAVDRNPCANVSLPRVRREVPGILTPRQFQDLLDAAPPELRPSIALQGFAGIRRAEAERLDWKDVHLKEKHIDIGAGVAKTASRRVVPIVPALAKWLALDARPAGRISPTPQVYRDRLEVAWRAAGMKDWPQNCLRHSAATYWLAHEEDANRIALWLGHSAKMLLEHYNARVPKSAAKTWFSVLPDPARFLETAPGEVNGNGNPDMETKLETKGKKRKRDGNGLRSDGNIPETPSNA